MARAVTESAMMAALSFVLYLASNIPLLGAFIAWLAPVPLTYVVLRHGLRRGIMSCACTCVLLLVVGGGPASAYLFLGMFGLVGIACGWMLRRDEPQINALFKATLMLTILVTPMTYLAGRVVGAGESMDAGVQLFFKQLDQMATWFNDPSFTALFEQYKKLILTLMVAPVFALALSSFVLIYVNHLITYWLSGRLGIQVPPPPNPYHMKFPVWLPLAYILGVQRAGAVGLVKTLEASLTWQVFITGQLCMFLAGMAAIARWMSPKKELPIPTFGGLLMFGMILGPIPLWLGIFDTLAGQPQAPETADAPAVAPDVNPAARS
jgi:uncharacterized protein YybS (DUF2232 family)